MGERDWHDLYLRGLMTQLDLERYEVLVSESTALADELASHLEQAGPWEDAMVSRARTILALHNTFGELFLSRAHEPIPDDPFSWPVEDSARTLSDRTAVRLLNAVLIRAIESGADSLSIAACEDGLGIVSRGAGTDQQLTVPRSLLRPLMARLKHVAQMDPHQDEAAQQGDLTLAWHGVSYAIAVRIAPDGDHESARLALRRVH